MNRITRAETWKHKDCNLLARALTTKESTVRKPSEGHKAVHSACPLSCVVSYEKRAVVTVGDRMQRSASSYHTDVKIFIAHFSSRFNLQAYFLRPSLYLSFFLYRQGEITKLNRLAAFYNRRIHTTPTSLFLSLSSRFLRFSFSFFSLVGISSKWSNKLAFHVFHEILSQPLSINQGSDLRFLSGKTGFFYSRKCFTSVEPSFGWLVVHSTQNPTAETRARPFQLS